MPLERPVVLEFEHFSNFISEYSANISLGGMFVKTSSPHLPETVFRFEIRLADDAPLIAGLAKVLWVREAEEGADRPAGMGVRFLRLQDDGRGLIKQIVQEHVTRGGRPFRLERSGEGEADPAAKETAKVPPGPPAQEASGPSAQEPSEPPASPLDKSAVIELPPLEELLEESRTPRASSPTLDTPPRGWKPGISAARPRTRPQLIATIAVVAAVLGAAVYLLAQLFASPPVLDEAETEPPVLPRAEASAEADEEPPPRPFTAVEEITWQRTGNGAEVVVRLDGELPEGSWSVQRMSDPPRHLLKLTGAVRPYPTGTFEVGFGGVRQLRTGFHDGGAGNEQHVVIDLVDPRVVLEESRLEGTVVRLRFRRLS